MSDLIDRQKVLNTLDNADKFLDEERTVEKYKELLTECIKVLPCEREWIPITYRPMTEEEKEHYSVQVGCDKEDLDTMLDCQLPDDGEEVLITVYGEVETDIFYRDVDGCSFENRDIEDIRAWMPWPSPWKGE